MRGFDFSRWMSWMSWIKNKDFERMWLECSQLNRTRGVFFLQVLLPFKRQRYLPLQNKTRGHPRAINTQKNLKTNDIIL